MLSIGLPQTDHLWQALYQPIAVTLWFNSVEVRRWTKTDLCNSPVQLAACALRHEFSPILAWNWNQMTASMYVHAYSVFNTEDERNVFLIRFKKRNRSFSLGEKLLLYSWSRNAERLCPKCPDVFFEIVKFVCFSFVRASIQVSFDWVNKVLFAEALFIAIPSKVWSVSTHLRW